MKRFLTFLAAMLLSFLPMNAIQPAFDGNDGDTEEIEVQTTGNEAGPNSMNFTVVTAYKTTSSVIIEISNFSGNLVVAILGIGGNVLSNYNPITGSGMVVLDISSLPHGNYMLYITANQLYQGSFSL